MPVRAVIWVLRAAVQSRWSALENSRGIGKRGLPAWIFRRFWFPAEVDRCQTRGMGPDLTDKRWIVAKGLLFAVLALLAGTLQLVADLPLWQEAGLLFVCVWASCRFYYFLFHVLQEYVDPGLRSAGVLELLGKLRRRL